MKKIIIISTIALFVGCISSHKSRTPSNTDDADFSKIDIDKLEQIYRFAIDNQGKYKILTYPASDPSHIENSADFLKKLKKQSEVEVITQEFRNSLWNLQSQRHDQVDFRTAVSDYVRPLILSRLNQEEKKQLISFCFGPKGEGDYYELAVLFTFECSNFNFLVTEGDIIESLNFISDRPEGVRYDGARGWHVYSDEELEYRVQLLTLAIATQKEKFIQIFDEQHSAVREKFRHNSHGMNEEDKVEPFDLLTSYSTWYVIGQTHGRSDFGDLNKIYIGKLIQKSMSRLFTMFDRDPESDKLPTMSIMKKEGRALFWCANGRFKPRVNSRTNKPNYTFYKSYGNDILEGMVPSFKLSELLEKNQMGFTFYCNTMEYKTTVQVEKAEPINPPAPIDYSSQNEVNALITVALVSEMNSSSLSMGKTYLSTLGGWDLVEDFKEIDTKDEFTRLFPTTDLYIPVSHAMDVNAFHVGTKKGYSLKLKKKLIAKDGTTKYINATILFPKSEDGMGSSLIMNPDSLSELLLERDKRKRQPLFLMNTSCGSEKTLFTWMATYRKVLKRKLQSGVITSVLDDHGAPHIVGSKRYFDTDSTAAIMSHLSYPVGAMEMLTKGHSVPEVVDFLRKDQEVGFVGNVMSFFSDKSNETDDNSPKNFEPDYVMDHPELLQIGGYKIRVNRRGFPSEREY